MKKNRRLHKLGGAVLALGVMLSMGMPVQAAVTQADLANPVVDEESHNLKGYPYCTYGATHCTEYHYVYFGSYPQREIKGEELTDEIINAAYDTYGNGEVNGKRYRRISYEFTTIYKGYNEREEEFAEKSTNGYRYYLYEPIKWRIYDNDGSTLFLVTDKAIEQQKYDISNENQWAECDLRRWLNYNGGEPEIAVGFEDRFRYHYPGFMYYAFTQEEIGKIRVTQVKQDSHPKKLEDGTYYSSGSDTEDKIFVLSYTEMSNLGYGTCYNDMYGCDALARASTDYARSLTIDDYWKDHDEKNWMENYSGSDFWLRTVGIRAAGSTYPVMSALGGSTQSYNLPYREAVYVVPALNLAYTLKECIRVSFKTYTDTVIEDQILVGGNYAKEPMVVEESGAETKLRLTRKGYVFTGWYTDVECTKAYNFNRKLTKDTILYAGWKKAQDAPVGVTGGVMKIKGTTSAMEYALSVEADAVWTSCQNGTTPVPTEGKWYVRYRETGEFAASEVVEVNVITLEKAVANYVADKGISASTAAITDTVILNAKNDSDIKGSSFVAIQARADKTTKTSVKLKWNKISGADGYEIYGAPCNTKNKKNKYKLIKTIKRNSTTTYTKKKLKKGTYYKYIVRAYKEIEGQKVSIAVSKTIHATTTGGKYGNAKKIKVNKSTITLKKGKKFTLKASEVKQSKKIQKHRAIAYVSSNTNIATVSKKGVIRGKKKGTCWLYVYAQNGVYKKIKVKVK